MSAEATICQECGMVCTSPTEYHPFAACLMFKACHEGDKVRANLQAVQEHATDRLRAEVEGLRASVLEEAATLVEETFAPMKRGGGRIEVGAAARWAFADAIRSLSGPKGQGSGDA